MTLDEQAKLEEAYKHFELQAKQGAYDSALSRIIAELKEVKDCSAFCRAKFEHARVFTEGYLSAYISTLDTDRFLVEFELFIDHRNPDFVQSPFIELTVRGKNDREILERAFEIFLRKGRSVFCSMFCRNVFAALNESDPTFLKTLGPYAKATRDRLIETPMLSLTDREW